MPFWLGNIHPRFSTPYAALIVQGIVSAVLVILNLAGAGVQETFQKLLSLAVVLNLVPFVYMFGALVKFAVTEPAPRGHYGRTTLFIAGTSGLLTTILGIALGIFPDPADHIAILVRGLDGRRHAVFRRPGRLFLFRLRPPQDAATTSCGESVPGEPSSP